MIGAALRAALGVAGAGEAVPAAPLFDYLATVLLDDPVALWMLDGDATDELGAHDGSAAGGLDYALAPWGTQSARIDDDAERINVASVPLSASNPRPFTVELWIKPTARPSLAGIMLMQTNSAGSNDNIGLRLESSGIQGHDKYPPSSGNKYGARVLTLEHPHHLAYVETASSWALYHNGEEDASGGSPETYSGASVTKTTLGNHPSNDRGCMGLLGRVAMYDSELTPARLRRHYYVGSGLASYVYARQPLGAGFLGLGASI
jgi:hypothetical protein